MIPVLFQIGPLKIHSFGLMMALSFLTAAVLAGREFKRRGYDPEKANEIGLGAMIGGVLGAKIYYLFDHLGDLAANPGMILSEFGSGLTWYGGFIGGTLGALLVARWRKVPLLALCDMSAPVLGLAYAVGRVGCFLNGDDYGRPSSLPWAMAFPKGTPPTTVPVQPTQLYEIAAGILMFAVLMPLRDRMTRPGSLFGVYLVLAGLERFSVEFARTNVPVWLGLTMAQLISVALMGMGLFLARRPARAPA